MSIAPTLVVPAAILVVAAAVDLRTRKIPNTLPTVLLLWAVASRVLALPGPGWGGLALGLLVGLVLGLGPFALGVLGGGDVKLLAALGAAIGPLALLVVAAWIALLGGVLALIAKVRHRRAIAYGPAIALGYVTAVWIA